MPRLFVTWLTGVVAALIASLAVAAPRSVRFDVPAGHEPVADSLAANADAVYEEVSTQLGGAPIADPPILVRVRFGEEAFQAAMPGAGVAEWAAGVAFPEHGLVVLRVDARTHFTLADVFRHELAHIALARAVGHRRLPLWFCEGLAVRQAGERLGQRFAQTVDASLFDALIPFAELSDGFPVGAGRADLAYAQSSAFVGHLLNKWGWNGMRTMLRRIRDGQPFEEAFRGTVGRSLVEVETAWRQQMAARASWMPVILGSGLLVLTLGVFIAGGILKRRRARRRLAELARESPHQLDDEFA